MGNRFISDGMVENDSVSIDSTMLKADGPVWHKSDVKNNRLPLSGIDIDAKWGFSKSKWNRYLDTNYTRVAVLVN